MRTLNDINNERKFKHRLEKLLREGRFSEARKVAEEHTRLLTHTEQFSCSEITNRMNPEHKELANLYLRKICILSDIVEGTGIDLLALLRKYDEYLSLPLTTLLENLKHTAREINKIIDAVGDESYKSSFGDVCDEIDSRIKDLFNKREV